ncbi:phosphate starvation-inducible PhoH-like protein [Amaricoccus macauensis]|uniref:PhoH-like protein n=1 Tax=Amaricoccus macauensis TaxID=57001 RepID=A0A840SM04_9RHOB|nr:PhoH family protein [Amaricoccus macauensis]MBB5222004.1 phosphate starvation-inducible PhoH-like protein [Amaricoccus macauensis]
MAITAPNPAIPDDASDTILEFPDNRLLIDLCGELDRNIAQVELRMGVTITRRGNLLTLHGPEPDRLAAEAVLRALYERLEQGRPLTPGDIDAAIRLGPAPAPAPASDGQAISQLEMFSGDAIEIRTRRKLVEPRTTAQKVYVRNLFRNELTFGIGPAGTGKTYLAVAAAAAMYIEGRVDKIILSRPAVEAGERLGFLPGDMKEKVDPYMQPLYDALNDFFPPKQVQKLIEERQIEIAPLAFMRGRTLANAYVVLDEAQNATAMQMKMFLTRLGEGSRMAVTGDPTQIDLPKGVPSGLIEAERVLSGVPGVAFTRFGAEDVVRHPLVARIIRAYETAQGKHA